MLSIFSASTGAIALISISMERSVHGGVHCENCTAKACHPAWGCGPDRANPDWGAQRRGQNAAWFRPKYECWIAVPTCPFTFDLCDLRPVAMIIGRITFLRPDAHATATGRTARSRTRFSDQNVYVTSRSMWEGKVMMTLWVRPGAYGALLEKSWLLLVPGEATKPILFRVDCLAHRRHFMHPVEVVMMRESLEMSDLITEHWPPFLSYH